LTNDAWTPAVGGATVEPWSFTMDLPRRRFVVRVATAVAASPFLNLVGCVADAETPGGGEDSGETDTGSSQSVTTADATTVASGDSTTTTGTTGDESDADGSTSGGDGSTGGAQTDGSTGSSTGSSACEPSPGDIEGPFYRPGIPVGSDLDIHGDDGVPLLLEGRVMDGDCAPIENAVVEIWHATPVAPAGEPGDLDATYDDTPQYRYYGQVATDGQGRYAFTTLRPGWYLNGETYRPAHVHVKVWVGGVERLTSQLYFVGDPFNAGDPWFNPVMALDPDGTGLATIDFVV
jgi:protocatechuate 3,4-dioxygenase beta subunit